MTAQLSDREVLALRLAAHGLDRAGALDGPLAVVERLFALQGQELPGALWSLGLRGGTGLAAVQEAFASGALVRSWPFRGTLFVLAARDLPWVLRLTATRTLQASERRRRELGLTSEQLHTARTTAERTLAGGTDLGRGELLAALQRAGLDTQQGRGYHLLYWLALHGVIVQGAIIGGEQRFALLSEWIDEPRELAGDAALAELVTRYVLGRGPVRPADIAWWSKLPLGQIRRGVAAAGEALTTVRYRDAELLLSAQATSQASLPARVLALPGFDEYMLGYQDRGLQLPDEHAPRIVPGGNGVFRPTIVSRGRVVGLWSRRQANAAAEPAAAEPFEPPLPATVQRGFQRAIAEYVAFLGS